jgi:hypothetical protein
MRLMGDEQASGTTDFQLVIPNQSILLGNFISSDHNVCKRLIGSQAWPFKPNKSYSTHEPHIRRILWFTSLIYSQISI